ncbi:MAG: glycoside hydrolase family 3 protein [Anaerolineae bacterium]|nr:glycoside hydrolase family 3 protein [Anaerolineae bacterium]
MMWLRGLLCVGLLLSSGSLALPTGHAQPELRDLDATAQAIIADMTPAQRVGQLVVVTFEGTLPSTTVAQLTQDYHVGGVMLLAAYQNIAGGANSPAQIRFLSNELQSGVYSAAARAGLPYVPLWIGTTHSGDGFPGTQITAGTTPLPSYLALGATWEPADARLTGRIAGTELAAMGINLLFSPALQLAGPASAPGVATFGGDPGWVARLAEAYFEGLLEGSETRLMIVAEGLPGVGTLPALPGDVIPVLPRTLDNLSAAELRPFATLLADAAGPMGGVQCANLRYLLPGTHPASQPPLCLDEPRLAAVLQAAEVGLWRVDGLLMSDWLGSEALQEWAQDARFPSRQVARDALMAGNDVLLLGSPTPTDNPFTLEVIADTLAFFEQSYNSDPLFKARVDTALLRVIKRKLALYEGDWSLPQVEVSSEALAQVGRVQ